MHKTLKDFLAAEHVDQTDKLAQRALKVHLACISSTGAHGLIANAHERGDGEALTEVSKAHYEASLAFLACNLVKDYAFASEVVAQFAVDKVETDQPAAVAEFFVGKAENTIAAYAERCAPVTRISGVQSVRILRGEHALNAMRGVRVANAA